MKDEYKFPVMLSKEHGCWTYSTVPFNLNGGVMTRVETRFSEDSRKCALEDLEQGDVFQACAALALYGRDCAPLYMFTGSRAAIIIRGGTNSIGCYLERGRYLDLNVSPAWDDGVIRYHKVTLEVK